MLTKKNIIKFIYFYLSSKIIIYLLSFIADVNFLQIFKIEDIGNPDLEWNDLHYKTVDTQNNSHYTREKSVVLINSGTLPEDSFRLELAKVISQIKKFNPKSIGIDIDFDNHSKIGTKELINEINYDSKIVVAIDTAINPKLKVDFKVKKGIVNFPSTNNGSIRSYFSDNSTFGYRLAKIAYPNRIKNELSKNKEFTIHYSTLEGGISNCDSLTGINDFKYIDANSLLKKLDQIEFYKYHIKNKIIIIGHLGKILNDSNDKHRIPCDTSQFTLRDRKMYGAVIHANAIENIIHPSSRYFELTKLENMILDEIIFIFFLCLLFCEFGRLLNILILVLLSIVYIIFIIKIMDFNIYIKVSNTLLYLLIIEEFYDVLHPYYLKFLIKKIDKYEKK